MSWRIWSIEGRRERGTKYPSEQPPSVTRQKKAIGTVALAFLLEPEEPDSERARLSDWFLEDFLEADLMGADMVMEEEEKE